MTSPYRQSEIEPEPPITPRRWLRPFCWCAGHRWRILRINHAKHVGLAHLHEMAGVDAVCRRCGAEWNDTSWFVCKTPPEDVLEMWVAVTVDELARAGVEPASPD